MKTKAITVLAVLTAASLCVFVLEAQIPPLVPVPGIKLGLANIFTLFALKILNRPTAFLLLLVRVILGALVTGTVSAMGYALCGGLVSFGVLIVLERWFPVRQLWILSALCAVAHNLGQLALAAFIMGNTVVFWYVPVLIVSGLVTGSFTGLTCQLVLAQLHHIQFFNDLNQS